MDKFVKKWVNQDRTIALIEPMKGSEPLDITFKESIVINSKLLNSIISKLGCKFGDDYLEIAITNKSEGDFRLLAIANQKNKKIGVIAEILRSIEVLNNKKGE